MTKRPPTLPTPVRPQAALAAVAIVTTVASLSPVPALATEPAGLFADAPAAGPDKTVSSLAVYPRAVSLETREDFHRIVVTATFDDGTTADVTADAELAGDTAGIAGFEEFTFRPLADGEAVATVRYGGHEVALPVHVTGAATERPVSFKLDVMPVFMREGCNTGSCHGSARGQDRFMLSLFGYDPEGDYFRLTREQNGRRINLALPEESALIEKAVEAVPHSGGKLFEPGSDSYQTLVTWLRDGAKNDPDDTPYPVAIELDPPVIVLEGEGASQQMTVRARYSDGSDRDVTPLAVFLSNNERSAAVSEDGLVTSGVRGEAFVTARFDAFTVGSQAIVIPAELDYARPDTPENNYIDSLVHDKLHRLRIHPSERCSDEVFLRRAYLDIVGLLPDEEAYRRFTADTSPDKRARLIDDLLARDEFADLWVMKFAELLQVRSNNRGNRRVSYKAALGYHGWIKDRLAGDVPMDEVVQDLLTSSGGTLADPQTNFYQVETDNLKVAENVAQVFLGMRLQCAQCHNHPFDRWTQDDYYGWAAFFSQIGRKQAEDPREMVIYNRGGGEAKHPVTNQNVPPKFLGGDEPDTKGKDRREVLAEWLTSPDNPWFAKNLANIVWSHFFGIGIIDPVDDVRVSNPASNPELLDELGRRFAGYGYDFRSLVRDICNSRTYQLSSQANASNAADLVNFSHARIRRQRAEVMLDTISQVTGTKNKFKGLPAGSRAVQVADGNTSTYFLTTFGRATRETVCSCEVKMDPNLGQALHLINGDTVNSNITRGGVVKGLVEAGKSHDEIVEALYVRCFSRRPTDLEAATLRDRFDETGTGNPLAFYEDTLWALLNAKEFLFNH